MFKSVWFKLVLIYPVADHYRFRYTFTLRDVFQGGDGIASLQNLDDNGISLVLKLDDRTHPLQIRLGLWDLS